MFKTRKTKRLLLHPGLIFIVRLNYDSELERKVNSAHMSAKPECGFFVDQALFPYYLIRNVVKVDYQCSTAVGLGIEIQEYSKGVYENEGFEDENKIIHYEGFYFRPVIGMGIFDGSYCFCPYQDGVEVL